MGSLLAEIFAAIITSLAEAFAAGKLTAPPPPPSIDGYVDEGIEDEIRKSIDSPV